MTVKDVKAWFADKPDDMPVLLDYDGSLQDSGPSFDVQELLRLKDGSMVTPSFLEHLKEEWREGTVKVNAVVVG